MGVGCARERPCEESDRGSKSGLGAPVVSRLATGLGLPLAAALLATMLAVAPAWGRSLGSVESGITAGPDGNLWAAWRNGGPGLYKVSVAGAISEVGLGYPLGPLAPGSDGNLWADVGGSSYGGFGGYPGLARIAPAGQEAFFPPPEGAVNAFRYEAGGMALGPDGNIWFTPDDVSGTGEQIRVTRITPTGQITEFPVPLSLVPGLSSASQYELAPREIAAGGGALWMLTERGIVKVAPDGQMSLLPVPPTGAFHEGLGYGPDGNLWATYDTRATNSLQIRRITPQGAVSAIPVPGLHVGGGYPRTVGITSGPDGNLWLADGQRILRMTPAGAISEFPSGLPPGVMAEAITAGPDGNIWFTGGWAIGRITLAGSVTTFPLPGHPPPSPSSTAPAPVAKCVVPNLRRKTLVQARKLLARAHCSLGRVTRPHHPRGKRRPVVVRQQPNAKAVLPSGSRVSVTLATKPR
jgi:virginiamycin B lyase